MQNGNILLRSPKDEDATALAQLANNKNIFDNVRDVLPHPYTLADAVFFIDLTKDKEPQINFAIEYDGMFCGMIGVIPQQDVYRLTGEIGYWLGEPFWVKALLQKLLQ